jgi:hypothetical protein
VSTSGFTISTSAGQTVTIKSASAAGAIKKGVRVLVLGTVNGTTITAGQIIVQPKSATAEHRRTRRPKPRSPPTPGGIVDRVVKLSNGEYEVHNIGVNWPHHIFVNRGFKVIGAD